MRGGPRKTTIRQILDLALDLERQTMAVYATLAREFDGEPELRRFWFDMARHEAAHCGSLMLVECCLDSQPALGSEAKILFDESTAIRLRSLLVAYRRELRRGVSIERAFEMTVDLESCELEDVVVDLLRVVPDPALRESAVKMLIHDSGELSYRIEKHTKSKALLARADALFERRCGAAGGTPGGTAPEVVAVPEKASESRRRGAGAKRAGAGARR